jgi:hypothetical protein
MNLDHLKKLGLSALIGLLLGMLAVLYIGPETTSGAALLITMCVLTSTIIGQLVAMLLHLVRPAKTRRRATRAHSGAAHESAEKVVGRRRNAPAKAKPSHSATNR